MKRHNNLEIPSSNPLQIACSGFLKAACDPENCFESRLWKYTGENRPMRTKESQNRNFMRLTEKLLKVVTGSVFKEQSKT
jgi:hypothetical protein